MKTILFLILASCITAPFLSPQPARKLQADTIKTRFRAPDGYVRTAEGQGTFESYLRSLPLKPKGAAVHYYNGSLKANDDVYEAVIDLPIGKKDLHQCADAVMRLRADYFYSQKAFDKIHFNFTNGFRADYGRWRNGERIVVKGNAATWVKNAKPSDSYAAYWSFMEMVFNYAGTASLEKELKPADLSHLKIGDVFIKGGYPGHAVIVVDMAVNKENKKVFMLAQSYMPAQELQILRNPAGAGPWYPVAFGKTLETPEWTFKASELRQF